MGMKYAEYTEDGGKVISIYILVSCYPDSFCGFPESFQANATIGPYTI
jgi:hypothetical protein